MTGLGDQAREKKGLQRLAKNSWVGWAIKKRVYSYCYYYVGQNTAEF